MLEGEKIAAEVPCRVIGEWTWHGRLRVEISIHEFFVYKKSKISLLENAYHKNAKPNLDKEYYLALLKNGRKQL